MSNCNTYNKDIELKLKEILDDVNKWLAFAETKNGAMVALNGALLAGLVNIVLNKDFNSYFGILIKVPLFISIMCAMVALTFSLVSFLPQLSVFNESEPRIQSNSILIFYGDIAKYTSPSHYVKDVYKHYYGTIQNEVSKMEIDYAKEIIMNSCIAIKKYRWFKLSLKFTISAIITPVPVFIAILAIIIIKKISN